MKKAGHPERSAAGAQSRDPEDLPCDSRSGDNPDLPRAPSAPALRASAQDDLTEACERVPLPTGTGRFWVYMLTNDRRTVLYIGITNGLEKRLWQHGFDAGSEFTRKYHANRLIYYENYADPRDAIAREKQLKRWSRVKKETLIARINPEWRDLGAELFHDRSALPDEERQKNGSSRAERSAVEGPRGDTSDSRSREDGPRSEGSDSRSEDNPDLPRGPSTPPLRASARDDRGGELPVRDGGGDA